jgi:hypothetical protein
VSLGQTLSHQQEKFMSENISLLKALLKVEASPSAPRLSSAQLLDAPENKAIQDIWALPPDNPPPRKLEDRRTRNG